MMPSKRRRVSDDEIDVAQSRAFERGESDGPEIRRLEKNASQTQKARLAARRQLDAMGEEILLHVERGGGGPPAGLCGEGRGRPDRRPRGDPRDGSGQAATLQGPTTLIQGSVHRSAPRYLANRSTAASSEARRFLVTFTSASH